MESKFLDKKYKQCLNTGQYNRFKHFMELNNIYTQCNLKFYKASKLNYGINYLQDDLSFSAQFRMQPESKAVTELRKIRLADKIESDRCQSKVQLEYQWLDYLKNQEEQRLLKDKICERNLQLRQERLELKKRELVTRERIELRKLHSMELIQEQFLKLEREKSEILKKIFI